MKKIFLLTALAVLLGVANAAAQQIAVVSESGETSLYQTLPDAINGASPGSVIYLPGGGFTISDDVKITKKLTIIGIGHRNDNDNVDGNTKIIGNLWFNGGSSGSAIMGCYIDGRLNIGADSASVNYVLIKYCNLDGVTVNHNGCVETFITQNYIRGRSDFNGSNTHVSNNVINSLAGINNGYIVGNIFTGYQQHYFDGYNHYMCTIIADYTMISKNIIIPNTPYSTNYHYHEIFRGNGCVITTNMSKYDWGENYINIGNVDWSEVFKDYQGLTPNSDFHFKEEYQQYSGIGIYGGDGFNDKQIAPVPYIVAKQIGQETDAAGKLSIKIRVKAGE